MDSHKGLSNRNVPFYLCNPARAKFVPTPNCPLSLEAELDEIRRELLEELNAPDLPHTKKHSTLEYYLGGRHDMDDMIEDLQLSQYIQKDSDTDPNDCTLKSVLKTSQVKKDLVPLDRTQLQHFHLQSQPEFSLVHAAMKEKFEIKQKKRLEKEKRKSEKGQSGKSQNQISQCSQESGTSLSTTDDYGYIVIPSTTAVQLKSTSTSMLNGTLQQAQISKAVANASKKSVAAALKGVRGLSIRGRGRGRPSQGRGKYHPGTKPSGRGRGRPRKHKVITRIATPAPVIVNLDQNPKSSQPLPTKSEEVSIKNMCELKMTFKLNRTAATSETYSSSSSSPSASPSSQSSNESSVESPEQSPKKKIYILDLPKKRDSLICKFRLSPAAKKQIHTSSSIEENMENEEDDKSLDLY